MMTDDHDAALLRSVLDENTSISPEYVTDSARLENNNKVLAFTMIQNIEVDLEAVPWPLWELATQGVLNDGTVSLWPDGNLYFSTMWTDAERYVNLRSLVDDMCDRDIGLAVEDYEIFQVLLKEVQAKVEHFISELKETKQPTEENKDA